MRRLPLLFLLPCLLAAEDRWIKLTAGPFEVLTGSNQRGRETMVRFEEFRHAVGEVVGETDLQTPQPVRILVFRNAGRLDHQRSHHPGPRPLRHRARGKSSRFAGCLERADSPVSRVQHGADAAGLRARSGRVFLHLRGEGHSDHRSARRRRSRISIGRASTCWSSPRNTSAGSKCCSTTCARAWMRIPLTATLSANPPPKSRRRPGGISTAGSFPTTAPFPVPRWRRRISSSGAVSDADARLARADLLAGDLRPPSTRRCCAPTRKSPKPKKAWDCWPSRDHRTGRGPPPFCRRDGGVELAARAATSSTPNWSRTTTRPPRPCCAPPASTPSSTSRSL